MTNDQLRAQNAELESIIAHLRATLDFLKYGLDIEIG